MEPITRYRLAMAAYHDAVWEHDEGAAEKHREELFSAVKDLVRATMEESRVFTWEDYWLLTAMRGDWAIKCANADTKGVHDFALRRELWMHDMALKVRSFLDEATLDEEAEEFQRKEQEEIRALTARPRPVVDDLSQ